MLLEDEIAALIHAKLADAAFIAALLPHADAVTLQGAVAVAKPGADAKTKDLTAATLDLIARIDLGPDRIRLTFDMDRLAQLLGIAPDMLGATHLAWEDAFTLR